MLPVCIYIYSYMPSCVCVGVCGYADVVSKALQKICIEQHTYLYVST